MAFSRGWTADPSRSAKVVASSKDYNFNYYTNLALLLRSCDLTSKSLMDASLTSNLNFSEERTFLCLACQAVDLEFLFKVDLDRQLSSGEWGFAD